MLIPILLFAALGAVRVAQKICTKKTAILVESGIAFFHYGAYYQLLAALVSLITLAFVGFHGFNFPTLLCSVLSALCLTVSIFSSIEAMKGCTLVLINMTSSASIVIPCVLGIFLFDEPMSLLQWVGLAIFIASAYFLVSDSKSTGGKMSFKTVLMLIAYFVAEGSIVVVQKYFAKSVPNGNTAVYSFLMFASNAIILFACAVVASMMHAQKKQRRFRIEALDKRLYGYGAILAVAIFVVNVVVTTLAKTVDSVVLFSLESIISISVTTAVGALVFSEKITVKKIMGILIGLVAVFIINL